MAKKMDHRTKHEADGDFLEHFVRDMTPEEEAEYNRRQEADNAALKKYMEIAMKSWARAIGEYNKAEEEEAKREYEGRYYENKKSLFGDSETENKVRIAVGIDTFAQIIANVNTIKHDAEWEELNRCGKIQSERERLGAVQREYPAKEFIKKYDVSLAADNKLMVKNTNKMPSSQIKKYIDKHRAEIINELSKEAN